MDENTKKKLKSVRDLIDKKSYQEALDEAQIIIYKNSKIFQAHLMAGFCYDKLNKYHEAQKSYLQVLDLKPEDPNAIKALCELYTKMGNVEKSTKYMESMLSILKNTDSVKYRQNLVKLVLMYQKTLDMQKIDKVFQQLLLSENQITQQFISIAEAYFRTAVTNQCFFLDSFLPLGMKGQAYRVLQPNAKQRLNHLLIQIVGYLYSVKIQYKMTNKDIANSIYQMKQYFPYASCFLMLYLLDQYCISQTAFNGVILQQIYLFLSAFFDKMDNCYLNVQTLQPQIFVVSAVLSYEFLAFMKQFFILDQVFNPYYDRLAAAIPDIQSRKVRQEYSKKIARFILKQCRNVNKISQTQNIENRLQSLKYRIVKLDGSYLEEVVAKMAMNCFVNYQKLSDMKNLLKTRINNLAEGQIQPHLYKYYYDYLIKIAKLYKSLDQQISLYDVISYIKKNDTVDLKYLVQYNWIEFGRHSKDELQKFKEVAREVLQNIEELLPRLTGSLKSQTIRRQTVLRIFLQQYDEVLDGFKLALGTDRTFENLQSMGFYYFLSADYERSLRYLKQAFVTRQDQYHLNRAIFISMIKLNEFNDAYSFLERIYEGFPNVYWVNYALAMNAINNRKIESAYKYLRGALEAFSSGVGKTFKFSYQKTIEGQQYSLLYMIDQNKFHILFDEVVIPQKKIYELFPMASSLFFGSNNQLKQIRIETQLGELLKLLGRNKSSYNHLVSAHQMLEGLSQQIKNQNILQVISTKKQYATMLFYVRAYKQSEELFKKTLRICQQNESANIKKQLMTVYQSEIHSLLFQVSVMRLDQLMKFESYEAVDEYINKFTLDLEQLKDLVKKPSLNYYKAKYQFYILCFLHNKKLGIEKSLQTIEEYLKFFGLNSKQVETDSFYNRLIQLRNEERIIVKQCLQDYFVLKYMKQNSTASVEESKITAQNLLPLIQLFPTSSVFYIVYAMVVEETKLKIPAFLKCIQLDRESPISVDLLASLFLKQKDYLTACKLFLKSLQIDLFSTKSYIGLCTCLYVLIGSAIKRGSAEDNEIIHKALNKINSYMEFLRIVDPSQNYHMLKFLKTLISDEPIPLFQLKAGLEQSRKLTAHKYSHKLLYQLLQDSTQYLKDFNVWKIQGRTQVLKKYLQKNNSSQGDTYQMGKSLLDRIEAQAKQYQLPAVKSGEIRIKIKCKLLNKICIAGNLFSRCQKFTEEDLQRYIKICQQMEQPGLVKGDDEIQKLQKTAKQIILATVIKTEKLKNNNDGTKILNKIKQLNKDRIYKDLPTFSHIQVYLDEFTQSQFIAPMKRYIFSSIHSHPTDPTLRKALVSWLVIVEKQNNKNTKKIKQSIDYRLEGAIQMNSDEQASNTSRFHKKYAIMFNIQQPNGWVGYIADEWQKKKQPKWIAHLNKILSVYSGKQNKLTPQSREKATWLLIQMNAVKINKQKVEPKDLPLNSKVQIQSLSSIFRNMYSNINKQTVNSQFKNVSEQAQMHLMKYIVPNLVKNYQHSPELQKILDTCIQNSKDPKIKGFYTLLKFISISSLPATNEDELINQLKKMLNIIVDCESSQKTKTHPNSVVAMKCMVALFSLNYEQLQAELNAALNFRLASYSDTVLINFFEMIRLFREVQQNHQGQNVFESFTEYVNLMLTIVKQPFLKGFFTALKAMANAIVAQENASKLSRQLKYAMLLSPQCGKSILSKQSV